MLLPLILNPPEAACDLNDVATKEWADDNSKGAPRSLETVVDALFLHMSHHHSFKLSVAYRLEHPVGTLSGVIQ